MAVSVILQAEFAGRGNGWTDISADLADQSLKLRYGVNGNKPRDRVAATGTLDFALNNSTSNSGGVVGYYSPSHTARRTGWKLGIRVRLLVVASAVNYYKFVGKVDVIAPVPGLFDQQIVACQAVDWMDEAARANVSGLTVQFAKRSDQLFSTLVASMSTQPDAIEIVQPGTDTYAIGFDTAEDENVAALTELNKIASSELGLIFIKGDSVQGGTLVFEGRGRRGNSRTNVARYSDVSGLTALTVAQNRDEVINKIQVVNHPRVVDAAATSILYNLQSQVAVGANASISLLGPYRDPNQSSQRVGGTSMVAPVAATDYTMNTLADGTGLNITANFSVVASYGGSGVRYTITNNGSVSGFITKLQARGKGVYSYQTVVLEAGDTDSQVNYGAHTETLDQPYQSDPAVGSEVAIYLAQLYKDPTTQVQRAEIFAPAADEALVKNLMTREISDRIGLVESVSGLTDDGPGTSEIGFFINQVEIEIDPLNNFRVSFIVAPADKTAYWLLEITGAGELDQNTILGFGQIVGHTDIAHVDTHGDVVHADVPHGDSHTDTAHVDAAHGDSGHADIAHSDVAHADSHSDTAHADTAHADAAHADSHSDVAHSDVAHVDDAHQDVAHADDAHNDTAHSDHTDHVDHNDGPGHADTTPHGDVAHADTAHNDTAHSDAAHADSHTDVAHSDTHNDTAHSDTAHVDAAHADSHSDTNFVDVPHSDSTHTDTAHVDTAHGDVAHADSSHTDTAHVDDHGDTSHGDI